MQKADWTENVYLDIIQREVKRLVADPSGRGYDERGRVRFVKALTV